MITEKNIAIPIYRYALKIVVFDSLKEAKERFPDIQSNDSKGLILDYGDRAIICVPPNDTLTVVHECEHIKNAIWKRIGFIPTPENDEPDAYLLEYIYKEVMKIVSKHLATQC